MPIPGYMKAVWDNLIEPLQMPNRYYFSTIDFLKSQFPSFHLDQCEITFHQSVIILNKSDVWHQFCLGLFTFAIQNNLKWEWIKILQLGLF